MKAQTRTEKDTREAKIRLSFIDVHRARQVLIERSRDRSKDESSRANCRRANEWLLKAVREQQDAYEIEIRGARWVLEGIGKACTADGLGDVGASILNQIATSVEAQ